MFDIQNHWIKITACVKSPMQQELKSIVIIHIAAHYIQMLVIFMTCQELTEHTEFSAVLILL